MTHVVICRGLPGSGKSFQAQLLANEYQDDAVICSADHHFIDPNGVYKFDPTKLGAAHSACRAKFVKALEDNIPWVIVDNTFTVWSEVKDYLEYALIAKADVRLLESSTPWATDVKECVKRNTHGVPLEAIQRMRSRYMSNQEIADLAKKVYDMEITF